MVRVLRSVLGVRFAGGWAGWFTFALVFMAATAVVAASPPYLEAVRDVLADDALERVADDEAVFSMRAAASLGESFPDAQALVEQAIDSVPGLADSVATIAIGGDRTRVRLGDVQAGFKVLVVSRPGAVEAVEPLLTGGPTDGVWIPESVADQLGAEPGDFVDVIDRFPAELAIDFGDVDPVDPGTWVVRLPVTGVYRDIDPSPNQGYFADIPDELKPLEFIVFGGVIQPQLLLIDESHLLDRLAAGESIIGMPEARVWWEAPLDPAIGGISDLRRLAGDIRSLDRGTTNPTTTLGSAVAGVPLQVVVLSSDVPDRLEEVEEAVAGIEPSIDAVALAAAGTALVVIALGSWFATQRIGREMRLLELEGWAPALIGARAATAVALPAATGAFIGVAVAPAMVRAFGPSDRLQVVGLSGVGFAALLLVGLVLVGVVVAAAAGRGVRSESRAEQRRWVWDFVLYGIAAVLIGRELLANNEGGAAELDLLRVMVPIVGGAAVVALAMRLASLVIGRVRDRGGGLPLPFFLAWRRIAAAAAGRLGMVLPIGAAVAVAAFSTILVASMEDGLESKAIVAVGGDVVARLGKPVADETIPLDVMQMRAGSGSISASQRAWLLVVDVERYMSIVPWVDAFGAPLDDFVDALQEDVEVGIAAVVAGPGAEGLLPGAIRFQRLTIQYEPTTILDAVPLMSERLTTIVVDRSSLEDWMRVNPATSGLEALIAQDATPAEREELLESLLASRQMFTGLSAYLVAPAGTGIAVIEQIASGTRVLGFETSQDLLEDPTFSAQRWAFGYLRLQAITAEVIAFAVLAFGLLEARRRSQLGRAMLLRMGASRRSLGVASGLEVAGLIALALAAGLVAGVGLATVLLDGFDPLVSVRPGLPLVVDPSALATIVWTGLGVGTIAWLFTERSGSTADVGRLLRG